MGLDDKIQNKAEEFGGKAKEEVGEHTDNPDMAAEGRNDQMKADFKQAGENVKDAFR